MVQLPPTVIKGFSEIADLYQGLLVDLWGVIHNGSHLYPGVISCLENLKQKGKRVVFFSNSPRRSDVNAKRLQNLGIPFTLYDSLITSGEDLFMNLLNRFDDFYHELGDHFYYIGSENNTIFEGTSFQRVQTLNQANFILLTGLVDEGDKVEDYYPLLNEALDLKLPMICANPDRISFSYGKWMTCAGELAAFYKDQGGKVHFHGKPYPPMYQLAFHFFQDIPPSSLLAVGDSFETDVQGAHHAGIDVAFIAGGIHHPDLQIQVGETPTDDMLRPLYQKWSLKPTYVAPGFVW